MFRRWVLLLRGESDSIVVRIWAHDEPGLLRIVRDLHPYRRIAHMREEEA